MKTRFKKGTKIFDIVINCFPYKGHLKNSRIKINTNLFCISHDLYYLCIVRVYNGTKSFVHGISSKPDI